MGGGPCWAAVERTMLGRMWWKLRCYMYMLVEHRYFETFIIAMILASSLALVRSLALHDYIGCRNLVSFLDVGRW